MRSWCLSRTVLLSDGRRIDAVLPLTAHAAYASSGSFRPQSALPMVGYHPSKRTARGRIMMVVGIVAVVTSMVSVLTDAHADRLPTDTASRPPHVTDPFARFIAEASHRFDIPEPWIRAVIRVESDADVNAVSSKGALGLMQIMPETWDELREKYSLGDDPYDPRNNILAGAAYLREMHDRYGSPGFLAAYNAGPERYAEHLATGKPLPAETEIYVARLAAIVEEGRPPTASGASRDAQSWTRAPLFVTRAGSDSMDGSESEGGRVDRSLTVISPTDRPRVDQIFVPASR